MKKGFTLIELMIVVALIILFSGFTFPISFSFFQESALKDQTKNLENSLRGAQAAAVAGRGDSSAGVKISEDGYIIFEGESYEERRQALDITVPFSATMAISGNDEMVFQKSTGLLIIPEEGEASVRLTIGGKSREITINSQGKIESSIYEPAEE